MQELNFHPGIEERGMLIQYICPHAARVPESTQYYPLPP